MNKKQYKILETIYFQPDIFIKDLKETTQIENAYFETNFEILRKEELVCEKILLNNKSNKYEQTSQFRLTPKGEEITEEYLNRVKQDKKSDIRFILTLSIQIVTTVLAGISAWNVVEPWITSLFS